MESEADFRALVDQYQAHVYRTAWHVVRDRDTALDVAQETFLAFWTQRSKVAVGSIAGWLFRAATNRAIDGLRRRRPRPVERASTEPVAPAAHEDAAAAERSRLVHIALAKLPQRQQQVVTMRILDGERFVMIAQTLGISEGAAKSHFRRGLFALTDHLAPLRTETSHE